MKDVIDSILTPLTYCVTRCVAEGKFPEMLKISRVVLTDTRTHGSGHAHAGSARPGTVTSLGPQPAGRHTLFQYANHAPSLLLIVNSAIFVFNGILIQFSALF